MVGRIRFLLWYFLGWLLFFEVARLLFLVYHFQKAKEIPFNTLLLSFFYGLRMDISVASYLVIPVCLFVIAGLFLGFFRKSVIYKIYSYLILFFVLLITLADLEIYKSWGFRIDATPLKYLSSPKEVFASISHLPLFWILLGFLAVYLSICFLIKKQMEKRVGWLKETGRKIPALLVLFLITASLIVPMRGGLQQIPMNQSMVYFSKENFANVTAINATWNFLHGVRKGTPSKNPYPYFDNNKAAKIVDSLYRSGNAQDTILKSKNPNVIIIMWESFTEKATYVKVDGIEITPHFNQLKKEGLYFSNAYASGDRTDKGLSCVLSGYPGMNDFSIVRYPNKSEKLNTLSGFFKQQGYHTSFYYGGETEFSNIKSYILQSRFDKFTDKNDFASKDQNSKWGAHDGVVANRLLGELKNTTTPFFVTWLTLSSHEPFETPVDVVIKGKDNDEQFANSHHYTDQVLFDFINQCKQQPWWSNTLVIVVADHGHHLLKPSNAIDNFRIPMLWLGGALSRPGVIVDKTVSQLDIATTLTAQIKNGPSLFPFSRNMFDSTSKPWAYFSFNNGFGFAQPGKAFVFDNVGRQIVFQKGQPANADVDAGKALQQRIFQDFIDK